MGSGTSSSRFLTPNEEKTFILCKVNEASRPSTRFEMVIQRFLETLVVQATTFSEPRESRTRGRENLYEAGGQNHVGERWFESIGF